MINFFKKILYKKKLVVFTMIFLSAIFITSILSVSALDQDILPINQKKYTNEIFKTPANWNFQYQEMYDTMLQDYLDNYSQEYPYYLMFASLGQEFLYQNETKPTLIFWKDMEDVENIYYTNQFSIHGSENNFIDFHLKRGKYFNPSSYDETYTVYTFNNSTRFRKLNSSLYSDDVKPFFIIDTNANLSLIYKYQYNDYLTSTNTFWFDGRRYNDGDIMINNLSNLINELVNNEDDYIIRKLYNFQIDLTNSEHLSSNHVFQLNYSLYNKPFQNLFKNFEFIGLVNDGGLYHWEKTDTCFVDIYTVTTSDKFFNININNIEGSCLDYYDKVKLIVNLDNAYLKTNTDLYINSNSIFHYNFLSYTSVVDILSNYKYVNFTTNKNDVKFDLMVRDVEGHDFYKRHFFKYFDKTNLKTISEYVRVFSEPFPMYQQLYTTRDIVLDKNKGLIVFTHEVVDNEVFIFEYKDVYYSFTDNDVNSDVVIIDEAGTPQEVSIDTEFPEPPAEEISNINDGVNLLKDGIRAVHILYSTFYNNLTIEFKILHNVFFTMLIILIVVKVVLK